MKRRTKIIIAGVAGAFALGGIAVASQSYSEHKKMKRLFAPEKIMEMVDRNGDFAASQDELSAYANSYFVLADADKDEKVTKAEIVAALENSELPTRLKDRSGKIADRVVRQGDIDQDGSLTFAELENRLLKFHALADWNDDKSVEIAEMKRLRGGFGRHGRRGDRD